MTTARSSFGSSRHATALVVALACASVVPLSAHRRDEYLQAARIAIEPSRVTIELDLTPGVSVAEAVVRSVDANADGVLTDAEQQAYARRVVARSSLMLDGAAVPARLVSVAFPEHDALLDGTGTIVAQIEADLGAVAAGSHRLLFRHGDGEGPEVYLANALVPQDDRVGIRDQRRDGAQAQLEVAYVLAADASSQAWLWVTPGVMLVVSLGSWLGVGGSVFRRWRDSARRAVSMSARPACERAGVSVE